VAEENRSKGAVRWRPKMFSRFHGIGAGEGGDECATMRIDLSGMIRSPVPTGVLVSHVGLRRQRSD
jgi:hypothetical protein